MRKSPGLALIVLAALCLTMGPGPGASPPRQRIRPAAPPTIEPTLPIGISLEIVPDIAGGPGGTARLDIALETGPAIPELTLDLRLPEGLAEPEGRFASGLRLGLGAGERRVVSIPLTADRDGAFPIRIEASFRLADGRLFRAGQGTTWRLAAPAPAGRIHAGAYEIPGVPLEDLRR